MTIKTSNKLKHIDSFLKGIIDICHNISQTDIKQFIDLLFRAWLNNQNIFLIGNGGSASTALHFAADLNNATADVQGAHQVHAISLVENISRFSALVNDRGWSEVYSEQLKNFFHPGDIVIAISVHGGSGQDKAGAWSQNLLTGLQYAKDHGGKALGLTGFSGGAMKSLCDVCVVVPYNTTPHVEGFHVVLLHLITDALNKKIKDFYSYLSSGSLTKSSD